MGREVKRVALDFQWPLHQVWKGYLNDRPGPQECPMCGGSGSSAMYQHLENLWYGRVPFSPERVGRVPFGPTHPIIVRRAQANVNPCDGHAMSAECRRLANLYNQAWSHHLNDQNVRDLVAEGRLVDFTHTWNSRQWVEKVPAYVPTADEVNEWSISGFGHDSINCWIVCKAECNRRGHSSICSTCKGEGGLWPSDKTKAAYESWVETEPPDGPGYQMWETVSEGSPISPVFETPEALARWLADTGASASGDQTATYDQWLNVCKGAYAPTMVMDAKGLRSGVAATEDYQ